MVLLVVGDKQDVCAHVYVFVQFVFNMIELSKIWCVYVRDHFVFFYTL